MLSQGQELVLQTIALAASGIYFIVAYALSRRTVQEDARRPHRAFILWWTGLGILGVAGAVFTLGVPVGALGLAGARAVVYGFVGLIFAMLAGLLYYLLYLYTGNHANLRRVVLFYVALSGLFVYLTESQEPYIDGAGAEPELAYADERAPGDPLALAFSLALVLPPLAAAVAYLGLYFRVPDRTSRYRILMVSGGIVLWFTYSALSSITQGLLDVREPPFAARLAGQMLGVLAALMVLAAYIPPGFARRRLHVHSIFEDAGPEEPPEQKRQARPQVLHLAA